MKKTGVKVRKVKILLPGSTEVVSIKCHWTAISDQMGHTLKFKGLRGHCTTCQVKMALAVDGTLDTSHTDKAFLDWCVTVDREDLSRKQQLWLANIQRQHRYITVNC